MARAPSGGPSTPTTTASRPRGSSRWTWACRRPSGSASTDPHVVARRRRRYGAAHTAGSPRMSSTTYSVDLEDFAFVLFDQLDIPGQLRGIPRYADFDRDLYEATLAEA